jgi:Holliday junction resolvasome RuvABC endonuclease subunit
MTTPPLILALDPSIKLAGYAVMRADRRPLGSIVEAGILRVPEGKGAGGGFIPRIQALVQDIASIVDRHAGELRTIVVETPLTITPGMGRSRSATTLPSYGVAVGAVLREAMRIAAASEQRITVVETSASAWSRGLSSVKDDKHKLSRVERVKVLYGQHLDLGPKTVAGNTADAILIGSWWIVGLPDERVKS